MRLSLLVFFFVLFLVIIVVNEFTVFGNLALFFLVVLFIQIIGDEVHVHGVRLRHLEFGLTLRTTQDLAWQAVPHCAAYYIPWNMKSTPERDVAAGNGTVA